ncbi:hypothetical protein CROQUDRAFT_371360 [Cronartium quercuum f. sp. fusiforme G11]|uniref:La-related protein 7 homolog xRRM domain-containing protein n=1 Tax=Cronartium quercuum f. sp. fusiforme G11 TaxID=708437 RepID=A0A9P6NRB9_9BASI|nr:hypothetical protein CROQUDRAFT_371360 [Cronartium quercuum f. sp. fusiforme G11]
MSGLVPRAVALRRKTTNQKLSANPDRALEFAKASVQVCLEDGPPGGMDIGAVERTVTKTVERFERIDTLRASRNEDDLPEKLPSKDTSLRMEPAHFDFPFQCGSSKSWRDGDLTKSATSSLSYNSRSHSAYQNPISDYALKKSISQSYPTGCVIWLTGLPRTRSLNKFYIIKLITHILKFEESNDVIRLDQKKMEMMIRITRNLIRYVDFQKGLDNCHVRFSNSIICSQFLSCLTKFNKLKSFMINLKEEEKNGEFYNFSKLKGILIDGRREEIYWQKIPLHLH